MKGKSGKSSGEGVQKGPKVDKVSMKAGACSGEGRLEKMKAYGSKPGKDRGVK